MTAIRPMRPGDADAVADLTSQLGYPADARSIAASMARLLTRPDDDALLVAVDDGDEPIGWIHVARSPALETSPSATIHGMVVDEGRRSAGIGAELLAAAEAWARAHGATSMTVRSRTTRGRAHAFYERHGYAETKRSVVFSRDLG